MLPKSKARSSAKAVQRAALSLQRIDDVHGGDGLSLGVLSVGHRIADDVLQEDLQNAAGLLVDQAADALDAAAASQSADGGLGDALDVITKNLAMALRSALSESLASLATARHDQRVSLRLLEVASRRRSQRLNCEFALLHDDKGLL